MATNLASRRSSSPGITLFASAARTATPTAAQFSNKGQSLEVVIDVTAVTATPSVVFNLERQDQASSKWFLILASAAIVGVGTTVLKVSPHLTGAANSIAKDLASGNMRVRPVHGDADSITYSVGAIPHA
jgi:hypothetical protein